MSQSLSFRAMKSITLQTRSISAMNVSPDKLTIKNVPS